VFPRFQFPAVPRPLPPSTIHSMSPALPSYEQAAALVAAYAVQLGPVRPSAEYIRLDLSACRVLAQPLIADHDQPPFTRSTRDGFACRADEVSTHRPLLIAGSARAGEAPAGRGVLSDKPTLSSTMPVSGWPTSLTEAALGSPLPFMVPTP